VLDTSVTMMEQLFTNVEVYWYKDR